MATYQELVDGFRCHETSWLRSRDDELEREQRRLKVEQLAVRRVLDERDALEPDAGRVGVGSHDEVDDRGRTLVGVAARARGARRDGRAVAGSSSSRLTRIATPETDRGVGAARAELHTARSAEAGAPGAEDHRGRRPGPLPGAPACGRGASPSGA